MAGSRKKTGKGKPSDSKPKARRRPARKATKPETPADGTAATGTLPRPPLLRRQDWTGLTLIFLSMLGIGAVGLWFGGDSPLRGLFYWAGRAAVQGVSAALIALFLWTLLSRRRAVSYTLVLGVGTVGLFVFDTAAAWRIDRERLDANTILTDLEQNRREIESLTPDEQANRYVDAYIVMRDIYWEINAVGNDRMSGYRASYEDYTATGGFLDIERLRNEFDLWYSLSHIQDLEAHLRRVEMKPLDVSDARWSVNLLKVDPGTRAAYENDLARTLEAVAESQAGAIAQERKSLRLMRNALEVLLESQGRYRIVDGKIIFDDPDDAARFTGKEQGS